MSLIAPRIALIGEHCQPLQGEGRNRPAWARNPLMGNSLRALRTEKGWTHDQAAAEMGVSRGQFIKLERGERGLTERTIALAAKAFGVSRAAIIDEMAIIDASAAAPKVEAASSVRR